MMVLLIRKFPTRVLRIQVVMTQTNRSLKWVASIVSLKWVATILSAKWVVITVTLNCMILIVSPKWRDIMVWPSYRLEDRLNLL